MGELFVTNLNLAPGVGAIRREMCCLPKTSGLQRKALDVSD